MTIEAANPGAAIGRGGSVLNDLKRQIGWVPTVVRTPPIPSKTVEEVRIHLRNSFDDRRSFLKKVGIRIARDPLPEKLWARNTALGGYREVGRSAHLLTTQNSKILIDCGIDPGSDRTPYFNAPELLPLDSLDAVVVTHAHLDHCGLVPVLLKYGYKGPIYCTAPTRDLMTLMLLDAIKVVNQEARKGLYDSSHVRDLVTRTIPLRWGETTDIAPDIRLTMHNAGHILGSSICHFHLGEGDHNLAYSGDIKFERSWLFNPATNRFPRLETLVLESTYGGYRDIQPSRQQATEDFSALTTRSSGRGGKLIVPGLRGRALPGGHARPRGADARGEDPEGPGLPRRDDLRGDGDPHRLPRVPEQPAPDADLPAGGQPVPLRHLPPGRLPADADGPPRLEGAVHRPRHLGHDERRAGDGVLPGVGARTRRTASSSSATRPRGRSAAGCSGA